MKQPIKVVMLPTEDKGALSKCLNSYTEEASWSKGDLRIELDGHIDWWQPQHLYITVSQDVEPIKEGDWCLHPTTKNISQHHNTDNNLSRGWLKIIATTDRKIFISWDTYEVEGTEYKTNAKVGATISQDFIKEFVANPDGEWEVEYDVFLEMNDPRGKYTEYALKLNQDNTVNITSVEEKMYSRDEVEVLCRDAYLQGQYYQSPAQSIMAEQIKINDWIKENL